MSKSATTPQIEAGPQFSVGVIVSDIALASADQDTPAELPGRIKIAPAGKVVTRDGRTYSFDPERLAARFNADGIPIPMDLDHAIVQSGAVGWIKALSAEADGLYGDVEWLETGAAALKARTHRFVSPTFHHTESGEATWLHSVALVAAPALAMPAIASAGHVGDSTLSASSTEDNTMKSIATALGLQPEADEPACLTAITALQSGKVDKAIHDETLAKLNAASTELTAIKEAARTKDVDAVLEAALTAKKITPAQRDHYASLCASDEGLESVKALLEATASGLAPSDIDKRDAPGAEDSELDPAQLSAKATAYQADQASKGITVDIIAAVNHVKGDSA